MPYPLTQGEISVAIAIPQTSALHMDGPATHVVVTVTIQPCVNSVKRPNMHPITPEAPGEANHSGTPSSSTMDDAPVNPLTGSPATTHQAIAHPATVPTVPPAVLPPVSLTNLAADKPPSSTPRTA